LRAPLADAATRALDATLPRPPTHNESTASAAPIMNRQAPLVVPSAAPSDSHYCPRLNISSTGGSHALVQRVEEVDAGPGEPVSVTEDPTERRDEPASDHLPVVARFRFE
jgi:hypothetical protein